jgi:YggT family protein
MKTLTFLLSTVIELYTMALLLRVWMQWARCDFYNPFSQFVVKITQPVGAAAPYYPGDGAN